MSSTSSTVPEKEDKMKRLLICATLLLLVAGCSGLTSWTNHAMGKQADGRVGAMYFNGTVLETPTVIGGSDPEVLVKIIGSLEKKTDGDALPQIVTISCRGDAELMGRCLKAQPGNTVKANGHIVQTGELIVSVDYFALK